LWCEYEIYIPATTGRTYTLFYSVPTGSMILLLNRVGFMQCGMVIHLTHISVPTVKC